MIIKFDAQQHHTDWKNVYKYYARVVIYDRRGVVRLATIVLLKFYHQQWQQKLPKTSCIAFILYPLSNFMNHYSAQASYCSTSRSSIEGLRKPFKSILTIVIIGTFAGAGTGTLTLEQCDQIWRNFAIWAKKLQQTFAFFRGLDIIRINWKPTLPIFRQLCELSKF